MNAKLINQVKFAKGEEVTVLRSYDSLILYIGKVINPDIVTVRKEDGKGYNTFLPHAATDGCCWGASNNSNGLKIRKLADGDREQLALQKAEAETKRQAAMLETMQRQAQREAMAKEREAAAWDANINNWTNRQLVNTDNGQIQIVRFDKNPAYGAGRFETFVIRFNQETRTGFNKETGNREEKAGYVMSVAFLDGRHFSCSSVFDWAETKLELFKQLCVMHW